MDIPFEAFKKDVEERDGTRTRRSVLLLWLNDEFFSQDLGRDAATPQEEGSWMGPLSVFDSLLGAIDYPAWEQRRGGQKGYGYASVAVRLIGPASSDSLEGIYRELKGRPGSDCRGTYRHLDNAPAPAGGEEAKGELGPWVDAPVNFKLISPLATAPQADLIGGDDIKDGRIQIPHGSPVGVEGPPCATLEIHRTIATDDRLIDALIQELRLRGVDPILGQGHAGRLTALLRELEPAGPPPSSPSHLSARDHVVLISEWDTKFGRTLLSLLQKAIRSGMEPPLPWDAIVPWIHRFSYVRGLDGDTPAAAAGSGQKGKTDVVALAGGLETGFKEPAVGTNQYDYLRRLTLRIADLDWSLKRNNQGSIKAFGILGNDYFDKLLILQALKERFPSHLYFTTDLDAGYLDAKVFRWARNLIIAAPYGLALGQARNDWIGVGDAGDLRGGTPPFRHSIQTSVYRAVLGALDGQESDLSARARQDPPLLFEVGSGRFFQLRQPGEAPADPSGGIQPRPTTTGIGGFFLSHAVTLILVDTLALTAPGLRTEAATPCPGLGFWTLGLDGDAGGPDPDPFLSARRRRLAPLGHRPGGGALRVAQRREHLALRAGAAGLRLDRRDSASSTAGGARATRTSASPRFSSCRTPAGRGLAPL